jgi:hypothetical protein
MADIDIQEKRRSFWPWIVGLLGLVLVFWVATDVLVDDGEDLSTIAPATEEQATEPVQPVAANEPAEVTRLAEECTARAVAGADVALEDGYIEGCIGHLTSAIDAVIDRNALNQTELSEELASYRSSAEQVTASTDTPEQSGQIEEVFDGAAALIARIEDTRNGAGDLLERRSALVQAAADAFSADRAVAEQRAEIDNFFREAAAALRDLTTN